MVKLEKRVSESGLHFRRYTDFHCLVRGRYDVNVYPTSNRAHLKGGNSSGKVQSIDQIIELAHGDSAVGVDRQAKRRPMTSKKHQLWRHSHYCGLCKEPIDSIDEATVDHIIPLARGGSNLFDNLQLAHASCNSDKGCGLR